MRQKDNAPGPFHGVERLSPTGASRALDVVRQIVPDSPLTWDTVLLAVSVALLPLFYLTLKNWTEAWLVVLAAVSVCGIVKSRLPISVLFPDRATAWLFASLTIPIVAVFLSIVIRGDLKLSLFQKNIDLLNGPGRLFLSAVALILMNYNNVRFLYAFQIF